MDDYEVDVDVEQLDEFSLEEAIDENSVPQWNATLKSFYELPLEYHKNTLEDWEQQLPRRLTIRTPSFMSRRTDTSVLSNIGQRYTRFSSLRAERLSRLELKQNFEFLRYLAIAKLEKNVIDTFDIINKVYMCKEFEGNEIPHRMFRWTRHDFLERRKVQKIIWVDVLQKDFSEQCLEMQKIQIDLEECMQFLKLIFKGARTEDRDEDFDIMRDIVDYVNDTYQFLSIELRLNKELAEHITSLRIDINKSIALTFSKSDQKHRDLLLYLEDKLMSHHAFDPIELRYQLGYYRSQVNQAADHCNVLNSKYEKDIGYYKELLKTETYCSQCALNTYYTEIENFKRRINELSAQYDREYESIDNMINYKKLSMEKIREQRKFFTEQIQRFHEEIQLFREREFAEKEKAALEIRLKTEADLAKKEARRSRMQKKRKGKK